MALSRYDAPVVDYEDVDLDEGWVSDNGATTSPSLKDVSGDQSPANDTKNTTAEETTVEVGIDETANKSPDATVGVCAKHSRNGANDGLKRTVALPRTASSSTLRPISVGIVVSSSRMAELQQQQQQQQQLARPKSEEMTAMTAPETRGYHRFPATWLMRHRLDKTEYPPDDFRPIATNPWLSRTAVQVDAETYFKRLGLYGWDGKLYWGVDVEAL